MSIYIVVEGKREAILLRRVLAPEFQADTSLRIIETGSASSAVSVPRTLLRDPKNRVIVITDADSMNPEPRRHFVEVMLKEISLSEEGRWHIFVMTPEFESILFENPDLTEEIFPQKLDDLSILKGKYEPHKVLSELYGGSYLSWENVNVEPLRKTETIQALLGVIHSFQEVDTPSLQVPVAA